MSDNQSAVAVMPGQIAHWYEAPRKPFTYAERAKTVFLFGGLTQMHDQLIESVFQHLGYRARALPQADNAAYQTGKEYGNRGQCNPTYFTVGNLVKYLIELRDREGLSSEQIVSDYVFFTAGACGPCRFGMYVTEYRKALRDAGFDGFRILQFQNAVDFAQGGGDDGLILNRRFFFGLIKTVVAGDVLNLLGYRLRPYERQAGQTDAVLGQCRQVVGQALLNGQSVTRALRQCRPLLAAIEVNYLQPKPKVAIIGEFWAMTTEGDGNYRLQRFLEQEGAECDIQPITNWGLYTVWVARHNLDQQIAGQRGRQPFTWRGLWATVRTRVLLRIADMALKTTFYRFARAAGLVRYQLPDMNHLASISHAHYRNELRGGEGHMEVGKLIEANEKHKAHLVLSVKPFGCMPSSAVSDGVQSAVSARFTQVEFLPIETSGDSAVNVYSRIQMALHKARQRAESEYRATLDRFGLASDREDLPHASRQYPAKTVACTAANHLYSVMGWRRVLPKG